MPRINAYALRNFPRESLAHCCVLVGSLVTAFAIAPSIGGVPPDKPPATAGHERDAGKGSAAATEKQVPSNCTLYLAFAAQKDDDPIGFYSLTLGPKGTVLVFAGPDWLNSKPVLVGKLSAEQRESVFRAALSVMQGFDFSGEVVRGGSYVEVSFTDAGSSLSAKSPRLKQLKDAAPGMAALMKLIDEILPAHAGAPIDDGTFTNPRWRDAPTANANDATAKEAKTDGAVDTKPSAATPQVADAAKTAERPPANWTIHFDCSCRDGSRRDCYYDLDLDQSGKGKVVGGIGYNSSKKVFDDRVTAEQAQAIFRAAGSAIQHCPPNAGGGQDGCKVSLMLTVSGGPKLSAHVDGTVFSELGPEFDKFRKVLDSALPVSAKSGKFLH